MLNAIGTCLPSNLMMCLQELSKSDDASWVGRDVAQMNLLSKVFCTYAVVIN